PESLRFVPARVLSGDSARDRAAAVQPDVPDVVVDPDHRDAARNHALFESAAAGSGGVHPGRALAAWGEPGFPQRRWLLFLAQFLPEIRPCAEVVGEAR